MAGELAVLLFLLAQQAWPRALPEAVGWTVYFGTYPWALAWLAGDRDAPAATMAILSASFALNVTLVVAIAWYAIERRGARRRPPAEPA
jgi:hypothetical protein